MFLKIRSVWQRLVFCMAEAQVLYDGQGDSILYGGGSFLYGRDSLLAAEDSLTHPTEHSFLHGMIIICFKTKQNLFKNFPTSSTLKKFHE